MNTLLFLDSLMIFHYILATFNNFNLITQRNAYIVKKNHTLGILINYTYHELC